MTLTGWPKWTYCTHRLEKQAKAELGKQKDTPTTRRANLALTG